MKNTLNDLNNYLFESLERLMDDDLSGEDLGREIQRAHAVTDVAEALIRSGELSVKVAKYKTEYGKSADVPKLLGGGQQ